VGRVRGAREGAQFVTWITKTATAGEALKEEAVCERACCVERNISMRARK
jgi:hypothetical protein